MARNEGGSVPVSNWRSYPVLNSFLGEIQTVLRGLLEDARENAVAGDFAYIECAKLVEHMEWLVKTKTAGSPERDKAGLEKLPCPNELPLTKEELQLYPRVSLRHDSLIFAMWDLYCVLWAYLVKEPTQEAYKIGELFGTRVINYEGYVRIEFATLSSNCSEEGWTSESRKYFKQSLEGVVGQSLAARDHFKLAKAKKMTDDIERSRALSHKFRTLTSGKQKRKRTPEWLPFDLPWLNFAWVMETSTGHNPLLKVFEICFKTAMDSEQNLILCDGCAGEPVEWKQCSQRHVWCYNCIRGMENRLKEALGIEDRPVDDRAVTLKRCMCRFGDRGKECFEVLEEGGTGQQFINNFINDN